jgi:DNA-binding MarR family transcriptional regulator
MGDDEAVVGIIETQVAWLMRLGEASRRATAAPHRALDRAAYVILRQLQQEGTMNVSALAAALNLDGSTVTRQLTALQQDGLIERQRDPEDGRGTVISATERGLHQVEAVREARRGLYGTVLRHYSPEEKQELATALERFNTALQEHMRTTRG